MAFVHSRYAEQYHVRFKGGATIPANDAIVYGVRVSPATPQAGDNYWKVIGVHHLTPEENRGNHHVYLDVLDETGQRVQQPGLNAGWTWNGRRPGEAAPPFPLDKPPTEPATNVPIYMGMELEVWIEGDGLASDHVVNLSTKHPDEPAADGTLGNSMGHHSYYVVFERVRAGSQEPTQPPKPTGSGLRRRLLEEADHRQAIQFNPDALLQQRIFADGFAPSSPEFDLEHNEITYIAQRAEHPTSGEVRVYYVPREGSTRVRFVRRA